MYFSIKGLFASFCGLCLTVPGFSQVAYTDFGPDYSFNNRSSAWGIEAKHFSPAFQFQATSSGSLGGFVVAIGNAGDSNHDLFSVNLYSDPGGQASGEGALLGSWKGHTSGEFYVGLSAPVKVAASGIELVAGDYYWFEVTTPTRELAWDFTTQSIVTPMLENGLPVNSNSDGTPNGAFAVITPESAPIVALGLGVFGLMLRKRRK